MTVSFRERKVFLSIIQSRSRRRQRDFRLLPVVCRSGSHALRGNLLARRSVARAPRPRAAERRKTSVPTRSVGTRAARQTCSRGFSTPGFSQANTALKPNSEKPRERGSRPSITLRTRRKTPGLLPLRGKPHGMGLTASLFAHRELLVNLLFL